MIEEFWIVDKSGICFFHRSIDNNNEIGDDYEQLLGGVFTGLITFSNQLTTTNLQKIETKDNKILFFIEGRLIFVIKAELNSSDKKIREKIKILEDHFIKRFKDEINNFNGEISSFKKFEDELDKIFKKISKTEKWGSGILEI